MSSIGPTAYYTGETWARHGLSHPEFRATEGRLLHLATAPAMATSRLLGGPTLDGMLLARHRVIDALLEDAIADGRVGQVLELAAGMSPRGWRFTERHAGLLYVEADLADMAARKRAALQRIGRPERHRVVELDALRASGRRSLPAVARTLDRGRGVAVITEGLLSYLPRADVLRLWRRLAQTLTGFPHGLYLSDLHVEADAPSRLLSRAFEAGLSAFVRSRVSVHFATEEEAVAELRAAGFVDVRARRAAEHPEAPEDPGARIVRVVSAAAAA